jgi:hypothetical protein
MEMIDFKLASRSARFVQATERSNATPNHPYLQESPEYVQSPIPHLLKPHIYNTNPARLCQSWSSPVNVGASHDVRAAGIHVGSAV